VISLLAAVRGTLRFMAERGHGGEPIIDQYMEDGRALPNFVSTEEDKTRWLNSVRVAAGALGLPERHEQVWSMAQVIYADRETYPS